jgi:tRNA threonylcarbamoyl adenosine modification protein YeaZ
VLVLSCDTSLPLLSVALVRDNALLGSVTLEGRGSRNEKLLPAIDWLLTENNVDRKTIDLFAVTRGPGSFTGVRIGLATMQGLALVLGKPVCTMSTHEAAAFGEPGRVAIVDDAGRGEHYVSVFEDGRELTAPHLGSPPDDARILAIADLLQRDNVALRCARRAIEIEEAGNGDQHRDVTPIYVRLAEAEVKLQQKQNG